MPDLNSAFCASESGLLLHDHASPHKRDHSWALVSKLSLRWPLQNPRLLSSLDSHGLTQWCTLQGCSLFVQEHSVWCGGRGINSTSWISFSTGPDNYSPLSLSSERLLGLPGPGEGMWRSGKKKEEDHTCGSFFFFLILLRALLRHFFKRVQWAVTRVAELVQWK